MNPSRRVRQVEIVPRFASRTTFRGTFLNLLLFGLTAGAGEWTAHQLEYLIEYGPRFGAVMATGPHRYYMAPLGFLAASLIVLVAGSLSITLYAHRRRERLLSDRLPARVRGRRPAAWACEAVPGIGLTFPALVLLQVYIYLLQENLEYAAVGLGWPGLNVLIAPQHLTVIPLHVLIALWGALLLRSAAGLLRRSRHRVQLTERLVRSLAKPASPRPRFAPADVYVPDCRPPAGNRGLRAPPQAA